MAKRRKISKYNGHAIAQPYIICLAMKYAYGHENRKKSKWLAAKLFEEEGITVTSAHIQKTLADFPRTGYVPSRQGGLYIISTKDEALITISDLEKRASGLLNRAKELRELYNIKD